MSTKIVIVCHRSSDLNNIKNYIRQQIKGAKIEKLTEDTITARVTYTIGKTTILKRLEAVKQVCSIQSVDTSTLTTEEEEELNKFLKTLKKERTDSSTSDSGSDRSVPPFPSPPKKKKSYKKVSEKKSK